ncbi:hypothetical protein [Nitrospirillum pindoramense]|uniref:Uncharacterized protein n=1 Tax=Nitrospirillum amazonense TaxID=28077 RepID=A0A560H3L1_9PROT|nr:hypothetical protein [Nitrospirillum amazonense]TWB40419.1 hypothetical protein FBZ90_10922 [Nitrospirillum amazonense]
MIALRRLCSAAVLMLTLLLAAGGQAAEQPAGGGAGGDLVTQAIRLLHPHYTAANPALGPVPLEDHLFLLGAPAFKNWTPAESPLLPADLRILALAERDEADGGLSFAVEVGLFTVKGGTLALLTSAKLDDPDMVTDQGAHLVGATLDLAPYRIGEGETAFGVRVQSAYDAAGAGAHVGGETLYLLRPLKDAEPAVIFSAPVAYEDADGKAAPKGTLVISQKKTKGFYDLLLKTGAKSTVYRWTGDAYEKRGG